MQSTARLLGGSLLLAGSLIAANPAVADESFVCESGSVVTVIAGDRVRLGDVDQCRTIKLLSDTRPALPERHPRRVPASETRALSTDEAPASRDEASKSGATGGTGSSEAAIESGTFRRVFVINAGSGSDRWFDHTR